MEQTELPEEWRAEVCLTICHGPWPYLPSAPRLAPGCCGPAAAECPGHREAVHGPVRDGRCAGGGQDASLAPVILNTERVKLLFTKIEKQHNQFQTPWEGFEMASSRFWWSGTGFLWCFFPIAEAKTKTTSFRPRNRSCRTPCLPRHFPVPAVDTAVG